MLSRHRPIPLELAFVHQDLDAEIGGVAQERSGLGRSTAPDQRERLVGNRLAACLAPAQVDIEVWRALERALENGFGFASAVRLHEKVGGEEDEARIRRSILECPEPLLGPTQRLVRALVLEAELR